MKKGDNYQPHTHPYYQLNHIVRGRFEYKVGASKFTAEVGDTVLIPAHCEHSFTQTEDESGYYFEVKFSSLSKGVMEMCSDAGVEKQRREKNTPSKYIEVSAYSPPVRDIIRFLEDNYKKRLTLDDIVAQIPLKKSYLCSLFKKETTVTIFECLMIIRVRKAVELLTYNPMPLAQVSKETGFVNITHFNRIFTKHVMIPPGQFRKYLKSQDLNLSDATAERKVNHIAAATLGGKKIDFPQIR